MTAKKNWKILQIIPAQSGWTAVHCHERTNHQIEISNRPIICWALVEAVGELAAVRTEVRGIEQESNTLVVVEDAINSAEFKGDASEAKQCFLGYNNPEAHKESDYWIKQANDRLRTKGEPPR